MKFDQPSQSENGICKEKNKIIRLDDILHEHFERLKGRLNTDVYEDAAEATAQIEKIARWREHARSSHFRDFYRFFEDVSALNSANLSPQEHENLMKALLDRYTCHINTFTPRVADMYRAILADVAHEQFTPQFESTQKHLACLHADGVLKNLLSGTVPLDVKHNNIERRLLGYLRGARFLDHKDGSRDRHEDLPQHIQKEREEYIKNAPTVAPSESDESQPGVDAMERLKEGEHAPALWAIKPPWGGYYREATFSLWDEEGKRWRKEQSIYTDVQSVPLLENETDTQYNITVSATVKSGVWTPIPMPYTHAFHAIGCGSGECDVKVDQSGNVVVRVDSKESVVDIKVQLAYTGERNIDDQPHHVPKMNAVFSDETNTYINEVKKTYSNNRARAYALATYVIENVEYIKPKDKSESEYYNTLYRTHPHGFAGAVDDIKKADCDVANTYFAALCVQLGIPVRHITGHSIHGKNTETGVAEINIGTGHAWSEVWDEQEKRWIRIDATPPGDPNLQKDGDNGEEIAGDFGENDSEVKYNKWSDEAIEKLRKELEAHAEKLSYTEQEREIAEATGVELSEARKIVKDIEAAGKMTLPNGERIKDVLVNLFEKIVQSRKVPYKTQTGPITRAQGGGDIMQQHIVRHALETMGGMSDPATRERPEVRHREEGVFNGFDFYLIADKTASTLNMVSREKKETINELQRRSAYLMLSALHSFEDRLEREGLTQRTDAMQLSVNTQCISYSGDGVTEDKVFGPHFEPADKVRLWHSLGHVKLGAGADQALAYVYNEIKDELIKKDIDIEHGKTDNRIRIIILCTDGKFFDDENVYVRDYAKSLKRAGAVVVGIGMTKEARNIPVVFEDADCYGEYTDTVNDLPAIIAKHVVREATRLFPSHTREDTMRAINIFLEKFQ